MNAYVYILASQKDGNKYIGSTTCLERRIKEHNTGGVKSTKSRRPFKLFGVRKFDNIYDAVFWEKKYKNSHGQLQRDITNGKICLIK